MPSDTSDQPLPTYEKAILQTVVYKRVREVVNDVLKSHTLNTTQWMVLGVLRKAGASQKISAIAHSLQVEVPLITTLSQSLLTDGYVTQAADAHDRRSKPLTLTEQGSQLVDQIESQLAEHLKRLEAGITPEQLADYFHTMQRMIDNAGKSA